MDIAERTVMVRSGGAYVKGLKENVQSCRPSLQISTLSMKMVPDAGSMIRKRARRSYRKRRHNRIKQIANNLLMISLPQFGHIFQLSPWVSGGFGLSMHSREHSTERLTIVMEISFRTRSSSGLYRAEYSLRQEKFNEIS